MIRQKIVCGSPVSLVSVTVGTLVWSEQHGGGKVTSITLVKDGLLSEVVVQFKRCGRDKQVNYVMSAVFENLTVGQSRRC